MIDTGENPRSPAREAFIAELLSSELTDVFESIELDDVVVWERDTV